MPEAFSRLAAPPLFITGVGRSGTTWTFDVFAQHPEVCAVFETWMLTPLSGVTGIFHQAPWVSDFYEPRRAQIGKPHGAVQLVDYDEMARSLGEVAAGWLVRRMQPEHRYLVEKGPLDLTATAAMFPDARFVHVLRDGRDVVLSMRAAATTWAPELDADLPVGELGMRWRTRVQAIRAEGRNLGDRYMEVRFEDLAADVVGAARRLFDYAGISYDDSLLAKIPAATDLSRSDPKARASGFRGRGRAGGWRGVLSRREARDFDRSAGDLLRELGYEHDQRWWRAQGVAPQQPG